MRATVTELGNAVRVFKQLSAASNLHVHGFDEKKIDTHVEYCQHLLDAARVHLKKAEHDEQQNRHKQEALRQMALAEEARRKAEEQRKLQVHSTIVLYFLSIISMFYVGTWEAFHLYF